MIAPVKIEWQMTNIFSHVYKQEATISLNSGQNIVYIPNLALSKRKEKSVLLTSDTWRYLFVGNPIDIKIVSL